MSSSPSFYFCETFQSSPLEFGYINALQGCYSFRDLVLSHAKYYSARVSTACEVHSVRCDGV